MMNKNKRLKIKPKHEWPHNTSRGRLFDLRLARLHLPLLRFHPHLELINFNVSLFDKITLDDFNDGEDIDDAEIVDFDIFDNIDNLDDFDKVDNIDNVDDTDNFVKVNDIDDQVSS